MLSDLFLQVIQQLQNLDLKCPVLSLFAIISITAYGNDTNKNACSLVRGFRSWNNRIQ